MTVLTDLLFSLVYYVLKIHICFGRRSKFMKNLLKAVAAMAVVLIINMIINIICNRNGFELNSTAQSLWSALIAIELYRSLAKNEADKDSQK